MATYKKNELESRIKLSKLQYDELNNKRIAIEEEMKKCKAWTEYLVTLSKNQQRMF